MTIREKITDLSESLKSVNEQILSLQNKCREIESAIKSLSGEMSESDMNEIISVDIDNFDIDITFQKTEPAPEPVLSSIPEPSPAPAPVQTPVHAPAAMDYRECKWMKATPGNTVKNIVSAISLGDRATIINILFKEDSEAFNSTISALNAMGSLDEAMEYINMNYPEWKLNSEPVCKLMTAVRRKLR